MYTDIKSFEDACKDQGKDPNKLPDYSNCDMTEGEIRFNLAVFKLSRIGVSLNKDVKGKPWKPGPNDDRWYPWTWWKKVKGSSGSGLSFHDAVFDLSLTYVASRLTYRESKIARYAFETFPDLFADMIIFHP